MRVGKYLAVFKLSWQNALEYRFNFLMGAVRGFIFLLTLYFLWTAVFVGQKELFDFTRPQILTYVLGSSLLSSLIFVHSMDDIADSIATGKLNLYLVRPINFLTFWFVRRMALRAVNLFIVSGELLLFVLIFRPQLFLPDSLTPYALFFVSLFLALFLFTLLDFIVGLTSFWTLRAYGPRFAFKMLMEFASGSFFPLNILPVLLFRAVGFLPFSLLVFFPLRTFLGQLTLAEVYRGLLTQLVWITVLFAVLKLVWVRGLRRYEALGG